MELSQAADTIVNACMGVKPEETVLVVVDEQSQALGETLWEEARKVAKEALILKMTEREMPGSEPPTPVAAIMREVDVVLAPTTKSLSHTAARREATKAGARIASMPGITAEVMARTMAADYYEVKARSEVLAAALAEVQDIHVTSPAGTDLHLSSKGCPTHTDHGLYLSPGAFGNLPAGEAYLVPAEGRTSGVWVIDGTLAGFGLLEEPLRITVRDGFAVGIEGARAHELIEMLDKVGPLARNIGEFAFGTNERARMTGDLLEDEKVIGTVHLALGNSLSLGGTVDVAIHLDGIVLKPTVTADGRVLMKDGELTI